MYLHRVVTVCCSVRQLNEQMNGRRAGVVTLIQSRRVVHESADICLQPWGNAVMRGISPGVDVLQTADVTLWAASRRRRQWLAARHPRLRRPSDVICRRWLWLSCDALQHSDNSWSRERTPAMPGVVHSIWNTIKISNKTPQTSTSGLNFVVVL